MDVAKWTRRYSQRTLQELDVLRSFQRWTDITLQTSGGGELFPAHRCVLASASPYFSAMLGNDCFNEATLETITLHDITEEGLRSLLKFVYSGCVDLTVVNIKPVLQAAAITQVTELMDLCQKTLKSWLDCDNAVDIWTYSIDYSLPILQTVVLDFVGKHLLNGIDRKVFLRFDHVFVERLLRETMITCTESKVLAVIMQWVQFNLRCRQKYARKLLRLIYWDRIHLKDTRAITVRSVKSLREMMTEASKQPSPLVLRGMMQGILLVGGFSADGPVNDMRFLPGIQEPGRSRGSWTVCGSLPTKSRLVDFAVCALPDGGIVVCGGSHLEESGGDVHSNNVFILDTHTNRWALANPMKNERSLCQAVWFRNFVYVFGGDVNAAPTCERYNICTNQWEFLGTMPCQSEGFAVCLTGSKVILSGGLEELDRPSRKAWCYDPEGNAWSALPHLPISTADHSMVYYKKKIYAIGGWTISHGVYNLHRAVFSYTSSTGWIKEEWELLQPKAFQQVVLLDNKIFLIGGGSLKASQRVLQQKSKIGSELSWFDLKKMLWVTCEQSGVEDAFWDHKALVVSLPRSVFLDADD